MCQATFLYPEFVYGVWWCLYSSSLPATSSAYAPLMQPLMVLAWLGFPRTVLRLALDLMQTLRRLDDHILHESCHRPSPEHNTDRPLASSPLRGVPKNNRRRSSWATVSSRRMHGRVLSFGAWRVLQVVSSLYPRARPNQ